MMQIAQKNKAKQKKKYWPKRIFDPALYRYLF